MPLKYVWLQYQEDSHSTSVWFSVLHGREWMGGVYGDLMAALEQMLSHLPAKGASNSCQAHGPSD